MCKNKGDECKRRTNTAATHLIPVDSSARSKAAFEYARTHLPPDHVLTLVHGENPSHAHSNSPPIFYRTDLAAQRRTAQQEASAHTREVLGEYRAQCMRHNLNCRFLSTEYTGKRAFAERLCAMARTEHAASIVLGSRCLTPGQAYVLCVCVGWVGGGGEVRAGVPVELWFPFMLLVF
jgi:nucleotide-binding universal stress UspA family protein